MKFTQLAFAKLLLLILLYSPEVQCAPKDCARLKQDTFELWLSVKETCDDGLKDCCQVYCLYDEKQQNKIIAISVVFP